MKKILLFSITTLLMISCDRAPKIQGTVLSLKEIKSIGELVTAEYYGEVLTSLYLMETNKTDTLVLMDKGIVKSAYNNMPENKKFGRIKDKNVYKYFNRKADKIALQAFKRLSQITGDKNEKLLAQIVKTSDTVFVAYYEDAINKQTIKKQESEDIVYLARGTVKVGYDLNRLDTTNIYLSPNQDTIYFVDFDPIETDLDINPWFYYPDTNITGATDSSLFGFQLIYAPKQKEATLADINRVKSECKILLHQEAMDRNIYEHAKQNAEQALAALMSMMKSPNGSEIVQVKIQHSKYFELKQALLYDLKISEHELDRLKEIVAKDIDSIDMAFNQMNDIHYQRKQLNYFLQELYDATFYYDNTPDWDEYIDTTITNIQKII